MTQALDDPASDVHVTSAQGRVELGLRDGERWWGGTVTDGAHMPLGAREHLRQLVATDPESLEGLLPSSQSSPLLVSTRGRAIWSPDPFELSFTGESVTTTGTEFVVLDTGRDLRAAYRAASARFFPPSGATPALDLVRHPQYNTWIDQPYQPSQESVLRYVRELLDSGMPPGAVFVDDCWAYDYGTWRFDLARFPDAKAMVHTLHEWGCRLMLWVVPFVSPDSAAFRSLNERGLLVRAADGQTAIRPWWNGHSALLDVSNPAALGWLTDQLDALRDEAGVDGFKFDAGDIRDYRADDITFGGIPPEQMCQAWAELGLRYPFNEFRACWKMGGQPLAQRLQDKPPTWDERGIGSLIPELLTQAMIGHAFACPDMIGGGEINAVSDQGRPDQEFFVRYTQIAAVAPMMQFSASPVRVLDDEHFVAIRAALRVRDELLPTILALAADSAVTGEPIIRPLAYHARDCEDVVDQFFIGPDLLVAPVLQPGATSRRVVLPEGSWQSPDGRVRLGPAVVYVPCELVTIPRFRRVPGPAAGIDSPERTRS